MVLLKQSYVSVFSHVHREPTVSYFSCGHISEHEDIAFLADKPIISNPEPILFNVG